jgi:alkanesulfonate monooxygenase SsuD/methylene tetrahydromethanopterin reductase-like flavin-dependent oxidoreductase (luciferase family)
VRIGIGLPNAVPERPSTELRPWAETAEGLGFHSLGTIDRLVYDILDPLVTLGVAAAVTKRVRLFSTVLNVGWRNNALLLAKQLASVDLISGGRLTAGLGLGGWPEDFAASGVSEKGRGKLFDDTIDTMRRAWRGEVTAKGGPMPPLEEGRPGLLLGGLVPASDARVARAADGWVAPLLNAELLASGMEGVNRAWRKANRPGKPQILTGRYFCFGPKAEELTAEYLIHYYGRGDHEAVLADSLYTEEHLLAELTALAEVGVDDVVLYPCSSSLDQVELLAEALEHVGARRSPTFEFTAPNAPAALHVVEAGNAR